MKTAMKKVLSLSLVLVLFLSIFPMTALATETNGDIAPADVGGMLPGPNDQGFEIYDPDGKKVFDVPYTNGAQFDPTPEQRKKAGTWRLRLKHPTRGYFAKCHVAFPGLPPYLGIIPQMLPGN